MSKYNICSVLVHVKQNMMDSVRQQLELQQSVEVHAESENGRLIITIEDESRKTVGERIMGFYNVPGVLSASMIYQFSDDDFNEDELIDLQPDELKPSELKSTELKPKELESTELKTSEERMSA